MIHKTILLMVIAFSSLFFQINAADDTEEVTRDPQGMKLRANLKLFYMPLFSIITPKGKSVFQEKQISDDIKNGHGYGAYLGMDIVDKFDSETFNLGLGFLVQETQHDSDIDLYHLKVNSYLFEVNLYNTFYRSNKLDIVQQFGLSAGAVLFDYDKNRDNFTSGMGAARYLVNLEFNKHWDVDIGGGLFVWGQPGETQGYGGFFMIQLGCHF